ncbi:hypothetical protein GCM10011583_70500 [Streptomyces camponoticapitis]|uniref:Uncharacterized protein n=1 Tax=Streptomyces camponoticapitis TaxID=1616125 RepID=A0ABQ2EZI1_9ACTN|nr:hypothetical protein GCM10011583_70500 [Streptomyces camponoticapitis]
MALMVPGIVGGVGGNPVDRQQGAVHDDERLIPDRPHRLGQGRGEGGQGVDGFAYVAVDGRDPDAEFGGKLGVGTAPQVGQGEQGRTRGGKAPPPVPMPCPLAVGCPVRNREVRLDRSIEDG